MVEVYVRTASEIERMDDGAFFARFGEKRAGPSGCLFRTAQTRRRGPNARIS